jgi:transcriptional regulator GlxA family with amidase domain
MSGLRSHAKSSTTDCDKVADHREHRSFEVQRLLKDAITGLSMTLVARATTMPAAKASLHRREIIMQRFHEAVSDYTEKEPAMTTLCRLIEVPQRTLNLCCQEQLGMSAKNYLILRRMYLANNVLNTPECSAMSVTDIATRFGFWNFGRFSKDYRELFGELPSRTRQDASDRGRRHAAFPS